MKYKRKHNTGGYSHILENPKHPHAEPVDIQKKAGRAWEGSSVVRMPLLAGPEFTDVELEQVLFSTTARWRKMNTYVKLFAFEDVAICTTALAWAARNRGVQATGVKLGCECRFNLRLCKQRSEQQNYRLINLTELPFFLCSRIRTTWFDFFLSSSPSASADLLFCVIGCAY